MRVRRSGESLTPPASWSVMLLERTWLLPCATAAFVVFVAGSVVAVVTLGVAPWIVPCAALPSFVLTWWALAIAVHDLLARPPEQLSERRRLAWLAAIALFNVVAFFPYWLFVARYPRRPASPADRA